MKKLKVFSVDIAFDGSTGQTSNFLEFLQEVCEVYQLEIVGLWPVGPGGGWPEVTFRGTEENLTKFAIAFFDSTEMGQEMIDEYMDEDEPKEFAVLSDPRFSSKGERKYVNEDGQSFKVWE